MFTTDTLARVSYPSDGARALWLTAYFSGSATPEPATALSLLNLLDKHFDALSLRSVHASRTGEERRPIPESERREWFSSACQELHASSSAGAYATSTAFEHLDLAGNLKSTLDGWYLGFSNKAQVPHSDCHQCRLYFGLSLKGQNDEANALTFCQLASDALLDDHRFQYGFINLDRDRFVRHPAIYASSIGESPWDQCVEMKDWNRHLVSDLRRVRGTYWGNLFGPDLANRLRDAKLKELLDDSTEELPADPPVLIEHSRGGLAVLIDQRPLRFARRRRTQVDVDSGCVVHTLALRQALRDAGLL